MAIYIYVGKSKDSHLRLDTGKSVTHNASIDLDENDLKKPHVQLMIENGKNQTGEERLVSIENPPVKPKTEPKEEPKEEPKKKKKKKGKK